MAEVHFRPTSSTAAGQSWVLCASLGCFQVTVVTESLILGTGCSARSLLWTEYREGLAQGSETASNIANNSYLTEVVSAYPNSRDWRSHTDIDNTNTKPTDKGKKERVISKSCVSCGKWTAIRWLTLNIPQSADIEKWFLRSLLVGGVWLFFLICQNTAMRSNSVFSPSNLLAHSNQQTHSAIVQFLNCLPISSSLDSR